MSCGLSVPNATDLSVPNSTDSVMSLLTLIVTGDSRKMSGAVTSMIELTNPYLSKKVDPLILPLTSYTQISSGHSFQFLVKNVPLKIL